MNSGIAKLESVRDDRGHRWAASVLDDERLPQLIVGTKVHIETAATGNVMYGFAVGDDTVAVSEWGDNGNFEFHVLERYEGRLSCFTLPCAVMGPRARRIRIGSERWMICG
ncbi:hypothetical protein LJR143_001556 [Pseudoxanthomonas sp. LjRoot143]|uniref:hypothetical protein n=1 Tax=Pseudoxanthomonas sp. LjRoot143 TaxID=3342266 RepID=UPI003ECF820D